MSPDDRFLEVYKRALKQAVEDHPKIYAYSTAEIPKVAGKMLEALRKGSANYNGLALTAAAKELGIKNTSGGWKSFLAGQVEAAPVVRTQLTDQARIEGRHALEALERKYKTQSSRAPRMVRDAETQEELDAALVSIEADLKLSREETDAREAKAAAALKADIAKKKAEFAEKERKLKAAGTPYVWRVYRVGAGNEGAVWEPMAGKPVVIASAPAGATFSIFRDPTTKNQWRVTEDTTGLAITEPKKTQAEAVAATDAMIAQVGPEKFAKAVASGLKGLAPRPDQTPATSGSATTSEAEKPEVSPTVGNGAQATYKVGDRVAWGTATGTVTEMQDPTGRVADRRVVVQLDGGPKKKLTLDLLRPLAQAPVAAPEVSPDEQAPAFKVGDRVTSYQGTGTIYQIRDEDAKLALEPKGELGNWTPLKNLTAAVAPELAGGGEDAENTGAMAPQHGEPGGEIDSVKDLREGDLIDLPNSPAFVKAAANILDGFDRDAPTMEVTSAVRAADGISLTFDGWGDTRYRFPGSVGPVTVLEGKPRALKSVTREKATAPVPGSRSATSTEIDRPSIPREELGTKLSARAVWYHGTPIEGIDPKKSRAPLFVTGNKAGAKWFAENRDGPGAGEIHELKVDVFAPFAVRNAADAQHLAGLLNAAGIKADFTPATEGTGWTLRVDEVEDGPGYSAENPIDIVYLPKAVQALRAAGYDSFYEQHDPLEMGEIEALALFNPEIQVQPVEATAKETNPESRYAGDKVADLLPTVEKEQGERIYAIRAIEDVLARTKEEDRTARVPGHTKKIARLEAELADIKGVYEGTYSEVSDAVSYQESARLRARVEGTASYAIQIKTPGEGWVLDENDARYATKADAERAMLPSSGGWERRVVESKQPVNRQWNPDVGLFEVVRKGRNVEGSDAQKPETGKPLTVTAYHGSAEMRRRGGFDGVLRLDIHPYGAERKPGESSDSLGTWWTASKADAAKFGETYAEPYDASAPLLQGVILRANIHLENPRVFESAQVWSDYADSFRGKGPGGMGRGIPDGRKIRKDLEKGGYDGFVVLAGGAGDATPDGADFYVSLDNKGVSGTQVEGSDAAAPTNAHEQPAPGGAEGQPASPAGGRGRPAQTGVRPGAGSGSESGTQPGPRAGARPGAPVPGERGSVGGRPRVRPDARPAGDASIKPDLYRISDADAIGTGTARERISRNFAAIRVVKLLEEEKRPATPEEQAILVKYVGWGGLPRIFEPWKYPEGADAAERDESYWRTQNQALTELLTDDEYAAARKSTQNAHYTSPMVIRAMWDAIQQLGVDRGASLEPSAGVGHFIGLSPDGLRGLTWAAVEKDAISAAITKALYPGAFTQHAGFEKAKLPDNHFTLAVSNFPFGKIPITDTEFTGPSFLRQRIHNYFPAKALDKVAPGGLVAFITTQGSLDSRSNEQVRAYLASRADFLGAIRLPFAAFKSNANTEVVTDLIFLRKRKEGEKPKHVAPWIKSVAASFPNKEGKPVEQFVNEYILAHPEMVLGTHTSTGKMRSGEQYNVVPPGDTDAARVKHWEANGAQQLGAAIKHLPSNVVDITPPKKDLAAFAQAVAPVGSRPFEFVVHEGRLGQVNVQGQVDPVKVSGADEARIRGLLPVRTALRAVYDLMAKDAPDADLKKAQATLNATYDAFVKKHGAISRRENWDAFYEDPDLPLVLSLENYDEERQEATKTAVFSVRTKRAEQKATKATSPSHALAITLGETGAIDLPRIAELLDVSEPEAAEALLDAQAVIDTPSGWQLPALYLSGNVRVKLDEAKAAAAIDPKYQTAVTLLEAAIPEPIPAHRIQVRLGSPWIPPEMVQAFVESIAPRSALRVTYQPTDGLWGLEGTSPASRFETTEADTKTLLLDALNDKRRVIKNRPAPDQPITINRAATALVRQRREDIHRAFQSWLLVDDADRRKWALETYNNTFNAYVEPKIDGSYLTFPGMADYWRDHISDHQRDSVARIVQLGNTLLAHVVGAGKTLAMVAGMMEMKRTGLARKPMMVVPNHLITQAPGQFTEYYPNAKVLVMTSDDLASADKRKRVTARIASGDWDAVIVPYSAFVRISMSVEAETAYQREILDQIETAILLAWAAETADSRQKSGGSSKTPPSVKRLENMRDRIQVRLDKLAARPKDDVLTFEQLGVDALFVDEAHSFKNLYFPTRQQAAGIPADNDVQRATDLYLKTRYINNLTHDRGIILATGTPVSNSMAEIYVMQRLLQEKALRRAGIEAFDAWLAQFGNITTETELDPSGSGMAPRARLKKFRNLPVLAAMFRQVADVKMIDDLPDLKKRRPKLRTGAVEPIEVPMSEAQSVLLDELLHRSENLDPKDRRADNMPKITTDGRLGFLDMRLLDRRKRETPNSKVSVVAKHVAQIYKEHAHHKGTQIVFMDGGTPGSDKPKPFKWAINDDGEKVRRPLTVEEANRGFDLYADLAKKLERLGIPRNQIAFIHDIDKVPKEKQNAARKALFRKVQQGEIRVLIGSTGKMGTGMNVQDRLVALHHVDPAWKPSDIEQRNGRILRQGNLFYQADPNFEVRILAYLTTGQNTKFGFDAYMWQLNEAKAQIISDFFRGDLAGMANEQADMDLEQTVATAAGLKAVATGNPRVIELVKAQAELERLRNIHLGWEDDQRDAQINVGWNRDALASHKKDDARKRATLEAVTAFEPGTKLTATVGGETVEGFKGIGEALIEAAKPHTTTEKDKPPEVSRWEKQVQLGTLRGLTAWVGSFTEDTNTPVLVLRHPNAPSPRYATDKDQDPNYRSLVFGLLSPDPEAPGGQSWRDATGLIQSVTKRLEDLREKDEYIQYYQDKVDRYEAVLAHPFEQQAELDAARAKVEEIQRELGLAQGDAVEQQEEIGGDEGGGAEIRTEAGGRGGESGGGEQAMEVEEPRERPNAKRFLKGNQRRVVARYTIQQSPSSSAPAVPKGTVGSIEDYADGLLWVDFGDPYGTVAAEDRELSPAPSGGGVTLQSTFVPGAAEFMERDVVPGLTKATKEVVDATSGIRALWAPARVSESAETMAAIMRPNLALRRQRDAMARRKMRALEVAWDKMPRSAQLAFAMAVDEGRVEDLPPSQQELARLLGQINTLKRREANALGGNVGYIKYYYPRQWLKPGQVREYIMRAFSGRRPLQGRAGFKKARARDKETGDIFSFRELYTAGYEPLNYNPITAHLVKWAEMDKWIAARRILLEARDNGVATFVKVGAKPPQGEVRYPDSFGTVYGSPLVEVKEAYDAGLMEALHRFATEQGITMVRRLNLGGKKWGYHVRKGVKSEIHSRFGGPEGVLMHEIGHALDASHALGEKIGLAQRSERQEEINFSETPTKVLKELRALADLRIGPSNSKSYRQYVRQRDEVIANLVHGFLYAPDLTKEVAPNAYWALYNLAKDTPSLRGLLDIQRARSLRIGVNVAHARIEGRVIKGHYYGPPDAVRLLENHLSPGLRGNAAFNLYRNLGNFLNQVQLGLSVFHVLTTATNSTISKGALALEQASRGKPLAALKSAAIASSLVLAPILDVIKGHAYLKAFYEKDANFRELVHEADIIAKGGGGVGWDTFWHQSGPERFLQAIRNAGAEAKAGNFPGAALRTGAAAWRAVPAAMELLAKPVMEWWVPRLKLAAYMDLAKMELADLGPKPDPLEAAKVLGRAWDSIDNRFGELIYDNIFWHAIIKDAGMASVRALGWNMGTVREVFGAIPAQAAQFGLLPGAGGGGGMGKPPTRLRNTGFSELPDDNGEPIPIYTRGRAPWLTHQFAYFVALLYLAAVMGAIYQFLHTGKRPGEQEDGSTDPSTLLLDLYFPRTGAYKRDGRPERASLWTYMKDVFAFMRHPIDTAAGKANPMLTLLVDLLRNEDYFGNAMRNSDDPVVQQAGDVFRYIADQYRPISVKNFMERRAERGESGIGALESFLGINIAPQKVTRTAAEDYLHGVAPSIHRTKDEAAHAESLRDLRAARQSGDSAGMRAAIEAGGLTRRSIVASARSARLTALQRGFQATSLPEAIHAYELGTPEERLEMRPLLLQKWHRGFSGLGPAQKTAMLSRFNVAMTLPTGQSGRAAAR